MATVYQREGGERAEEHLSFFSFFSDQDEHNYSHTSLGGNQWPHFFGEILSLATLEKKQIALNVEKC
jgi:hypothetical protein